MEATTAPARTRIPAWLAGLIPLLVLGVAIAAFVALDAPGLERNGIPVEELSVERTVLHPGEIELTVRNDGPDPVKIAQAVVNDGFADFSQTSEEIGHLGASTVTVQYPWIEGEAYEVALVTSTGGTVNASVDVAAETPDADLGFFGLMALVGLYVGVIPVAIGMLWLPWIRRIDPRYVQFLLALTLGLLGFLAHRRPARGHGVRRRGLAGVRRRGARVPGRGDRVPGARGGGRAAARHRGEGEVQGRGAVAPRVPRGARHRPAQPGRGPGDRLRPTRSDRWRWAPR